MQVEYNNYYTVLYNIVLKYTENGKLIEILYNSYKLYHFK